MLFFEKLNQKKIVISIILVVCIVLGIIVGILLPKKYTAASVLVITDVEINNEKEKNIGINTIDSNTYSILKETINSSILYEKISDQIPSKIINIKLKNNNDTLKLEIISNSSEDAINANNLVFEELSDNYSNVNGNEKLNVFSSPIITSTGVKVNVVESTIIFVLIGIIIDLIIISVEIFKENKLNKDREKSSDTSLKVLANIPFVKKANYLIDSEFDKSETNSEFKKLRINIKFLNVNQSNNDIILITSPYDNMGKTFVASNLSISFANAGLKTLIIDANLNKGMLNKVFEVSNDLGLSNYLSNLDLNGNKLNLEISKFIKETRYKNLNLILSGSIPPNSAEILSINKFGTTLKELQKYYDVIILDGTSALNKIDSLILSRVSTSTIIISEYKNTKIEDLIKTKNDIQNVGGRIIGLVENKNKSKLEKIETKKEENKNNYNILVLLKIFINKLKTLIKINNETRKQKLLSEGDNKDNNKEEIIKFEDDSIINDEDTFEEDDENIEYQEEKDDSYEQETIDELPEKNEETQEVQSIFNIKNKFSFLNKDKIVKSIVNEDDAEDTLEVPSVKENNIKENTIKEFKNDETFNEERPNTFLNDMISKQIEEKEELRTTPVILDSTDENIEEADDEIEDSFDSEINYHPNIDEEESFNIPKVSLLDKLSIKEKIKNLFKKDEIKPEDENIIDETNNIQEVSDNTRKQVEEFIVNQESITKNEENKNLNIKKEFKKVSRSFKKLEIKFLKFIRNLRRKINEFIEKKKIEKLEKDSRDNKEFEIDRVEDENSIENNFEEKNQDNIDLRIEVNIDENICTASSNTCYAEKCIRGIDKIDGFFKAYYSSKLINKSEEALALIYSLASNQTQRVDPLVYSTLNMYDETCWNVNKTVSNKAEIYAMCMAVDIPINQGESIEEYEARQIELRFKNLNKFGIDIEYVIENLWKKKVKMPISEKIALNKYAKTFGYEQKMIRGGKHSRKQENSISNDDEKILEQQELENEKRQEEIKRKKEEKLILKQEKAREDRVIRKIQKEKEAQRRKEEKQEKQKIKEEKQRKNEELRKEKEKRLEEIRYEKELEKEKRLEENRIEEELMIDNLYPKTKNNKNL